MSTYGTQLSGAGNATLTNVGYTALWVGFAVFTTATAVLFVLSYIRNVKAEARLMYYTLALLNAITMLAYLIMAMGGVSQSTHASSMVAVAVAPRTFQWIRYAAWALCAPITIFIFGHLTGTHWVEIVWVSLASIISVASLYAATVTTGFNATWPVFAFGIFFGLAVLLAFVYTFRFNAYRTHIEIGRLFDILGFGMVIFFAGYAITWGVSEGGFYTTQDMEVIIYAFFDIITKAFFAAALIYARESIARYGSFLGGVNTGVDFDFPIAKSTYTSSAVGYAEEPKNQIVMGEHRDLGFAQLHAATNTTAPASNVNWWPEQSVPDSVRQQL